MPVPYKNIGPVEITVVPDYEQRKGKDVIVTGGSSGFGAGYVLEFLRAGSYVTNADLNPPKDFDPTRDGKYQFVQCNVTKFAEQVDVFKSALKLSPVGQIDIVVANAGISGSDPVFALGDTPDPEEPDLSILNVDLIGVMYTIKCAQHYWQFDSRPADEKCFIIKSSLAGYITVAGASQYSAAKYGVRGLLIQNRMGDRCRVNLIAPWFIKTAIMSETIADRITSMLDSVGTGWAEVDDSVKAVLRVASDKQVNGRALAIVPRGEYADGYADGYVDLKDDFGDNTDLGRWAGFAHAFMHRTLPKEQQ